MKSEQITVALDHEFTAIQCECGQKFILLAVIEPSKEDAEYYNGQVQLWSQAVVYYCPFCGKKGEIDK